LIAGYQHYYFRSRACEATIPLSHRSALHWFFFIFHSKHMKTFTLRGRVLLLLLLLCTFNTLVEARTRLTTLMPAGQPTATTLVVTPGSLAAFTTALGTASAQQPVTVTGTELSGNVTATAPAGFEVSWTAGANFSVSQILTQTGGSITNVPLYIRMSGAALGSFSGVVTITSPGATAQTVAVSGTVTTAATPNLPARITGISPASGGAGAAILVHFYGTDFVPGATAVILGNGLFTVGPATFISSTHITAMVTVRATPSPINGYAGVINPAPGGGGGPSIGPAVLFTALPVPPVITSFTPTSGPAGTIVTIRGNSLYLSSGGFSVSFNGTAATISAPPTPSEFEVTARVPAGATTGLITVTNANGGAVSATPFVVTAPLPAFFEDFETGVKNSYTAASVQLQSGGWTFGESLIGTTAGVDKFNGLKSARLRGGGFVEMDVDKPNGAGVITVSAANYATETGASFVPEISTDGGVTYTSLLGSSPAPTLTGTLTPYSFTANRAGNVRLRFSSTNTAGATNPRINLDDIGITDYRTGTAAKPGQGLPALSVFPNPAQDRVTVQGAGAGPVRCSLSDVAGRQLLAPVSLPADGTLALPVALPAGLYLLQVETPTGRRTLRLATQ
jgi:hypothetical protein